MPLLARRVTRSLLKTVPREGQSSNSATSPLPPASSDESTLRDPTENIENVGSKAEENRKGETNTGASSRPVRSGLKTRGNQRSSRPREAPSGENEKATTGPVKDSGKSFEGPKEPPGQQSRPLAAGCKRKRNKALEAQDDIEVSGDEKTGWAFTSHSSQASRRIKTYGSSMGSTNNIHAAPSSSSETRRKPPATNGFKRPNDILDPPTGANKSAFLIPKCMAESNNETVQRSVFKQPERLSQAVERFDIDGLQSLQPIFKYPASASQSSSPLSSPLDVDILGATSDDDGDQSKATQSPLSSSMSDDRSRCPMCKAPVSREFLKAFSNGQKMNLRAATDFCAAHKQKNAANSVVGSQYPAIDWERFADRVARFQGPLHAILDKDVPSVYRQELEEKVASGKNRNALRNPDSVGLQSLGALPGYYGAKGARRMMELVMSMFAEKLRFLAANDKLFTEVGVGGFVQSVLVPELAILLVREDFGGCDEEKAREILQESAEVGEFMNAEEEEKVTARAELLSFTNDSFSEAFRATPLVAES